MVANKLSQQLEGFERQEEEQATQQMAASLKLPYVNLIEYPILPDVLDLVPFEESQQSHVVPYLRVGSMIKVATSEPTNVALPTFLKTLANRTRSKIELGVCSRSSLNAAQDQRTVAPEVQSVINEALKADQPTVNSDEKSKAGSTESNFDAGLASLKLLADRIRQVNTSEMLDVVFSGAVATGATDIHIEPQEEELRIRFRIDGVLLDVVSLPKEAFQAMNSRIKFLAKLKLDIVQLPQDGRFEFKVGEEQMDVRTSSVPGIYGEIITLRLLPHKKNFLTLEELGFTEAQLAIITEAMRKPFGIILSTGPTGSGKTTTLYGLMAKLNRPEIKIMTLEDPIEYRLAGIDQSQVSAGSQYTFAKGLRSALRQDPDVLMVGEVRDGETATTAVEAAMTGHLVLSTLHTNDAPGAIPRLLEMGVRPFLLSGVIDLIIAQRLVRRICQSCHGAKCDVCHQTGYKGRLAIAELLVPNRAIEDLIVKQGSTAAFREAAEAAGMISMTQDGMEKVKQGLTDEAEIHRVTGEKIAVAK